MSQHRYTRGLIRRGFVPALFCASLLLCAIVLHSQTESSAPTAAKTGSQQAKNAAKDASEKSPAAAASIPKLVDLTASTGISFQHLSSPEQKYIVESMSGGVALIDYDGDGWLDIYFTNAPSVAMALVGKKAKSALYHNNHDGTFTDVTDKAGVGYPCWAMGAAVEIGRAHV